MTKVANASGQAAKAGPEPDKVEDQEVEAAPLDAVIVVKDVSPDGAINTRCMVNGSVQPTEVETLLGLALKGWREQLGL